MNIYRSKTFCAIPPGETLKEVIENRNMTQKELACRMKMSEKFISQLINGDVPLTQDVALRLERVFGVEAGFWNRLEAGYREEILKVEYENSIDQEINFAKPFGYAKLARLGIIPETKKKAEQVINLQKFFEVASLESVADPSLMPLVFENLEEIKEPKKSSIYALVQYTKGQARWKEVNPYNKELLTTMIPQIKELSKESLVSVKEPLKDMLGASGIIIIYLPILDDITSTCITYTKGNSIVLGIPTDDTQEFWDVLLAQLENLIRKEFHYSKRKYRNNDPVTVIGHK